MTHDQGRYAEARIADAMQLAAADPGGPDVNDALTRAGLGLSDLTQFHLARRGED